MDKSEIDKAIETFMHPVVFTGVKPLLLVAEELATKEHFGGVIDAVWVHLDDEARGEFSYITKFAVKGKILNRDYYSSEVLEPYKGRLALPETDNLEKMIAHRAIKEAIEDVRAQRNVLAHSIRKDFESLGEILQEGKEVFLFKKGYGDWLDPFYEINIDLPYSIVHTDDKTLKEGEYKLKHPKTGVIKKAKVADDFFAYIVGSKAEISGLHLKDKSYQSRIEVLKDEERSILESIEWLSLDDPRIKAITDKLPRDPFEAYFNYVKKGQEAKRNPDKHLIKALELMVLKHMPKLDGPFGIQYIPIDNLLYLFHEVIPRAEALKALEACDIVCEPSGLLLGYEGKHVIPPKFLVPVTHVVSVYQKFPSFIEACERYLSE